MGFLSKLKKNIPGRHDVSDIREHVIGGDELGEDPELKRLEERFTDTPPPPMEDVSMTNIFEKPDMGRRPPLQSESTIRDMREGSVSRSDPLIPIDGPRRPQRMEPMEFDDINDSISQNDRTTTEILDRLNFIENQLSAIRSQTETINERLKNLQARRRY